MKNILFLTDFSSSNFRGSYTFIKQLLHTNYKDGLTLTFLHAYGKPIEEEPVIGKIAGNKVRFATEEMQQEILKLHEKVMFPEEVVLKTVASESSFSEAIHDLDEKVEFDLIIIVLKKETFFEKIFKSKVSSPSKMVNDVKEPILFIPANEDFSFPQKVIYGIDLKPFNNQQDWDYTTQMLKLFNPQVEFVHINTGMEENTEEKFKSLYEKMLKDFPFEYQFIEIKAASAGEGLKNFIEKEEIDLAVLIERKERFLKSFLGDSIADELSGVLNIPLLVISEKV